MRSKQRFGMSDVEPAPRDQLLHEALDQGCLRRSIEVDHHVAAEDRVERTFEWPTFQEIELPKGNERARHLAHTDDRSALAFGRLKVVSISLRHIVIDRVCRIFSARRLSE